MLRKYIAVSWSLTEKQFEYMFGMSPEPLYNQSKGHPITLKTLKSSTIVYNSLYQDSYAYEETLEEYIRNHIRRLCNCKPVKRQFIVYYKIVFLIRKTRVNLIHFLKWFHNLCLKHNLPLFDSDYRAVFFTKLLEDEVLETLYCHKLAEGKFAIV